MAPNHRVNLISYTILFVSVQLHSIDAGATRDATPGTLIFNTGSNSGLTPNIERISFKAGDVISCEINGAANHILLATSTTHVAHAHGGSGFNSRASLGETEFKNLRRAFSKCKVDTGRINALMLRIALTTPYSSGDAVERARNDIETYNNDVYYDLFGCNCEHWVNWWKYGVAHSFQALPSNSQCPI